MVIETRTVADHSSALVSTSLLLLLMPSPLTSRTEKTTWDPTALTIHPETGCPWRYRWCPQGRRAGGRSQRIGQALADSPQHLDQVSRWVLLCPTAGSCPLHPSLLAPGGLAWLRLSLSGYYAWKHGQLFLSLAGCERRVEQEPYVWVWKTRASSHCLPLIFHLQFC